MSDQKINEKLNQLDSMKSLKVAKPGVPVSVVLQEAADLYEWCILDKETLMKVGLDWNLVDDLETRAGALRLCQAKWSAEYKSFKDCQSEWKVKAPEAFNLRDELVHDFFHALYKIPAEYAKVKRIAEGSSNADMIQDLIELSELGMKHRALLEAIGLDLGKLDLARTTSFELTTLLGKVNGALNETSPMLELRDKAYCHLKEAMDEIRRTGQYVFWRDPVRYKGYLSEYMRRKNKKHRNNDETDKAIS